MPSRGPTPAPAPKPGDVRTPDAALAAALRAMRESQGVSREALALQAGLGTATLARIELARAAPAWETVRRLAAALGVSLVELAGAVEAADGDLSAHGAQKRATATIPPRWS